jgi:hypothetical protein
MQTIEQVFNILVEKDEDGFYVAMVVELPGCHTQAKMLEDQRSHLGLLAAFQPGTPPQFVGVQKLKLGISK